MRKREYYSHGSYLSKTIKISLVVLLVLIVLAVFLFFYLQKYIVYTPDGLILDIPFLRNARAIYGK